MLFLHENYGKRYNIYNNSSNCYNNYYHYHYGVAPILSAISLYMLLLIFKPSQEGSTN